MVLSVFFYFDDATCLACKMLAYYAETRAPDALRGADDRDVRAGVHGHWREECTARGIVKVFGRKGIVSPEVVRHGQK